MKKLSSLFLAMVACTALFAQQRDSITVSLNQAEEIFLKKNLLLLSYQYQVDAAKANELQEKLYNNPSFSTEIALYGANKKWFDAGSAGQKTFGIDQLITLAGKRNKRVLLAKEETREANFALYDLLRTLKYELRQSFYTVTYAAELVSKYDDQMQLLQRIITSYDEQAAKRNVPLKDAVRLKTEYIQLSADRNSIIMESITAQQTLQLLLDTTAVIVPQKEEWPALTIPSSNVLIEKAIANRTDLKIQESQVKQEQLNYNLQKALAVPDLTVGTGYDQNGSYINNLYTIRAAIDIPLFNRNQGNIKAAKARIQSAETARSYKQSEIEKEVLASIARMQEAEREYKVSQQSFNKDFPEVNRAVIENFNKGNLSILEFMDFFENYNSAIRQINQLQKQRRLSKEELEFSVGASLYN